MGAAAGRVELLGNGRQGLAGAGVGIDIGPLDPVSLDKLSDRNDRDTTGGAGG